MAIIIKKMETEAEWLEKAQVQWQAWQETYTGLVDQSFLDALSVEKLAEKRPRGGEDILIAKDGSQVVGFVVFGAYGDERQTEMGEIYAIYILRAYYDRGVGYALMKAAVSRLRNCARIALWVLKGNERAIKFYQRFGFRFDGVEQLIDLGSEKTELRMIYNNGTAE